MARVLLAWMPVLAVWAGAQIIAWCRFPVRRGAIARRLGDLRSASLEEAPSAGLIDLSRRAAAYYLALRAGAAVRGCGYALMFVAVFFTRFLPLQLLGLGAFVLIETHWRDAAKGVFALYSREPFTGFDDRASAYQFPRYRRGVMPNFFGQAPGMAMATAGFALVLASGLPLAWESDTIPTPIPGLYIQHSDLPYWAVALIVAVIGVGLLVAGTRRDRAKRQEDMLEGTRVPEGQADRPRMVFLRPFGTETSMVSSHPGPRRDGFRLLLPRHHEFLEDVAMWLLWSRGEVVSIARPGTSSKTSGAAHHRLRDPARWQAAVSRLIASASGIVLVPGVTPGVAWEHDQVRRDPDLAARTLFLNPTPRGSGSTFLGVIGASPRQVEELRARGLRVLGGMLGSSEPQLICSSLDEDLDIEMAVDWFLREGLPPAPPSSLLSRVRSWAGELFSPQAP